MQGLLLGDLMMKIGDRIQGTDARKAAIDRRAFLRGMAVASSGLIVPRRFTSLPVIEKPQSIVEKPQPIKWPAESNYTWEMAAAMMLWFAPNALLHKDGQPPSGEETLASMLGF